MLYQFVAMYIEDESTGNQITVEIDKVMDNDYDIIKELGRFDFDWDELKGELVYKLVPVGTNDIEGLIAIIDHPEEGFRYLEVKLIESAKENIGANKKYTRVAGTLLSFACREAFRKGYYGAVFLIPKTNLVPLYIKKYGFKNIGRGLWLDIDASLELMSKFQ